MTFLAILFPYFVVEFIFEHRWPFIIFGGICLILVMVQKKYWHND
jgi:hypothetical protein